MVPDKKENYKRQTPRLPGYDYSQPGCYFITICTHLRRHAFGHVTHAKMCLNPAGILAETIWQTLPQRYPHVELDHYVVMPNHLHGLIEIKEIASPKDYSQVPERFQDHMKKMNEQRAVVVAPGFIPPTIGEMVRTFKGAASYAIHASGEHSFAWQGRCHILVVRNTQALQQMREYIVNNPARWEMDHLSQPLNRSGG